MRTPELHSLFRFCLLGSIFFTPSSSEAKPAASAHCEEPVARLLSSGDAERPRGALLCKDDTVRAVNGGQVIINCHRPPKSINVTSGKVSQICGVVAQKQQHRVGLWDIRNVRGNNVASLQRPHGSIVSGGHPIIQWQQILGATEYEVRVEGSNLQWRTTLQPEQTYVMYPETQPEFEPGKAYKITVLAHKGNEVNVAKSVYRVLSLKSAQRFRKMEQLVSQLNLTVSEEAIERDAVFMTFGLIDQSISYLETLVKNGADQSVKGLLAERYEDANAKLSEPATRQNK